MSTSVATEYFTPVQKTCNILSPALKAVLLMFVLLIAAQPAQTKSPEISLKPVPAAKALLGGAYCMYSYPANSLSGPLLYLPTSITLELLESVAVRTCGSTAGNVLPASPNDTESRTKLPIASSESVPPAKLGISPPS